VDGLRRIVSETRQEMRDMRHEMRDIRQEMGDMREEMRREFAAIRVALAPSAPL
jgi:uncharacterized coiled-coil protein SlyX